MFKDAPKDIIYLLKHENVTVNAHQFCIVDEVSTKEDYSIFNNSIVIIN